ncbi:TetR/AcrR family transcriptional regulator [Sinanaerobacter chloroacetimidivorans]|jgi:AcrR family transcriptional regulator|uniref:TetR/AcrR family transcriptional regulator n=1 Tax=Sinanaerobacter chloroacetimidivorans TaxID=2818044 RepID=A0A8J8B233_9FIRM|nr:TetR/AcrR family transcriptional regulator [Sinanaerobacter chloroacetimidivorans]MBR0599363.1 TetR/AcrR family transcriptional regulator [Sinanaerobacter chloroacetimidivorans]
MDGFERRKERKKENIRKAALTLFSTYGVQKVSVSEIAKKAKVSQVTIYNYFGSKDELLRDVLLTVMNSTLQEYTEAIESDLPFTEKLQLFISEKTSELAALNPDFLNSMMSEDPEIRQIANDFVKNKFYPLMLKLIEKGKEEGTIKHDISNEAILLYINMFRGSKHSDAFQGLEHSQRLFQDITTLFFYGLIGK